MRHKSTLILNLITGGIKYSTYALKNINPLCSLAACKTLPAGVAVQILAANF